MSNNSTYPTRMCRTSTS